MSLILTRHPDTHRSNEELLEGALLLACERIADGHQQYHEANTPDGWAKVFVEAFDRGMTTDEVLSSRPAPQAMTDEQRMERGIIS